MNNRERKIKIIKWLLIGIGLFIIFGIAIFIDNAITDYNRGLLIGGVYSDRSSIIPKSNPIWIADACIMLISFLGLIVSAIMFIISIVSWWINNDSVVERKIVETHEDTLIKLCKLYKEGLLTKEEFERKKKLLVGGK